MGEGASSSSSQNLVVASMMHAPTIPTSAGGAHAPTIPPLQSLINQLRHGVSKNEKPSTSPMPLHPSPNMEDDLTNDELLLDDESEPVTYHEPESPSSDTWSAFRFKSRRLPPVPSIAPATPPSPTATRAPCGLSTARIFKSRRSPPSAMYGPPPPSPSATSMGPSSKSPGGLFRSNGMTVGKK